VLHARTIQEAQSLVTEFRVELFILDLTLPDGSGLDFMFDMQTLDPDVCVILASATDSARLDQMRLETGAHNSMSKPLDLHAMVALVRDWLEKREDPVDSDISIAHPLGFTARLRDMVALDVIQFRAVTHICTMLEFSTPEFQAGRVYLEEGHITHAEAGKITGMEALVEILSWQSGAVR
jgi:DNA-binding response OmpR family regulator